MKPITLPEWRGSSAQLTGAAAERLKAFAPRERTKAEAPPVVVEDGTATIRLYDSIDDWGEWWGVSAREFASTVDAIPSTVTQIDLLVNSPGGILWDAVAIMNMLRNHPASVTATVEGLAASAASFIAVSADELVMMPGSQLMIHDAYVMVVGDPTDLREAADYLDRASDVMAQVFVEKAGGTTADWRERMRVETWYSAEEALEAGLADRIGGASMESDELPAAAAFDLSIFKFAGRAAAPAPDISPRSASADESQRRRARQLALLGL